jgi:hypothetical protein
MAANRNLKQAYITLKGKEREIFKNKEIVQITADEYLKRYFPVIPGGGGATAFTGECYIACLR